MNIVAVRGVRAFAALPALAMIGAVAVAGLGRPALAARAAPVASATTKPVPAGFGGHDWTQVKASNKIVALTFDAGANADGVRSILSTLRADHVPATFMLTGAFARDFPRKARDIARAGALVGDHSMTHPDFTTLTDAQIRAQVVNAQKKIISVTGADPWPWFRFPYGARNARTIRAVNRVGFAAVRWTVDTLGWMGTSGGITVRKVIDRVLANLKPGEIVLMHCGSNPTDHSTLDADALPALIRDLRDRGYSFVTLDAMLGYRELTSDGAVHAYGSAFFGSMAGKLQPGVTAVGLAPGQRTGGYWLLKSNGGVNAFNAPWYGSLLGKVPDGVRVAAIAAGRNDGYLVLTSDGDVHAFNRPHYGSDIGKLAPGVSAVGLTIDPVTGGYWILKSNGGVSNFHAPWRGSLLGQLPDGVRVTAIAGNATGAYYVLTADGGVHAFGVKSFGSLAGKLPAGVTAVGLAADPATGGYWILKSNGGVNGFAAPLYSTLDGKLANGVTVTGLAGQ
jgi:peptidoglycan/xylan/chitin deacetylase (PgdA/CDA1 family)